MTVAPLPYFHDGGQFPPAVSLSTIWVMGEAYAPFVYLSDGTYVTFYNPGRNAQPATVALVGSQPWVVLTDLGVIARWTLAGGSGGSDLTITTTGWDLTVLPSGDVWALGERYIGINTYPLIARFTASGGSAGSNIDPIPSTTRTTLQNDRAEAICAVGSSEVWVADFPSNLIVRLTTSGTTSAADLTGNGLGQPASMRMVNGEVWVLNNATTTISRFTTAGASAGAAITLTATVGQSHLCQVGPNEVWVVYSVFNGSASNFIRRIHLDGTSAGSDITNIVFGTYLFGLAVIS